MTGDDLRKLRERRGIERQDLAEAINASLGTYYTPHTVGRWERGRPPAKKVTAFLDELAVSEFAAVTNAAGTVDGDDFHVPLADDDRPLTGDDRDTAPGPGPQAAVAQPPITSGRGAYVLACEELWEMVATGVGMLGAATNNMALVNDGAIIAADKKALGAAWGKLAETNETFRRMLVGMTDGGAWLQVALVTGTTFSKCWQGHTVYTAHARRAATEAAPEVQPDGQVDRDHLREAG